MSKKTLTVEDLKKEMKEKGHKVINHISVGLYAKGMSQPLSLL